MFKQYVTKKFASKIFGVLLLLALFGSGLAILAQTEEMERADRNEIVRVETDLVTVPVTVLDREGRYITNLKMEDFQIFEDGTEQGVSLFETSDQPITVLLLLDVSGSMASHLSQLRDASLAFVNQLRPNDQIIAATFDDYVHLLFNAKSVKDVRENNKLRITRTSLDHETMVYDAVEFAINKLKKTRGRKAIIVFSDGVGSGYRASAKSNLEDAEESEAPIYSIRFRTVRDVNRVRHETAKAFQRRIENTEFAGRYMAGLSDLSGGRYFHIEEIKDLEKTFGMISDELRRQYNLGYYPKHGGKPGDRRQIKVRVKVPGAAVRARSSYIVGEIKGKRPK